MSFYPTGIPMFISNPHFLHADKEVIESVEGMMPDPEKHETLLDIDPVIIICSSNDLKYSSNVVLSYCVDVWTDLWR